jgi:hypothetical protein
MRANCICPNLLDIATVDVKQCITLVMNLRKSLTSQFPKRDTDATEQAL